MKRTKSRQTAFLRAVLSGIGLPGEVEKRHHFRTVVGSDLDRMRSDVERVGRVFGGVLQHERKKTGSAHHA